MSPYDEEFLNRVGARGTEEIIEYADDALMYICNSMIEIKQQANEIERLREALQKIDVWVNSGSEMALTEIAYIARSALKQKEK